MPFGRAEPPVSAALLADKALMGSSRLKTGASQVALVVKPPPPTCHCRRHKRNGFDS